MLKKNEPFEPDYKKWVVTGECIPQIAASLILGINPEIAIEKDPRDWQNIKIRVKEVEDVYNILCERKGPWWYYNHLSIFEHVDNALKNRINVEPHLMNEINEAFLCFTEADQIIFIEAHAYISKNLNLLLPLKKNEMPTSLECTETEKQTLLKLVLGMAMDKYGYDPTVTRNKATGNNNGSIRAGLQSFDGLDVSDDTIRKYLDEAVEQFPNAKPIK